MSYALEKQSAMIKYAMSLYQYLSTQGGVMDYDGKLNVISGSERDGNLLVQELGIDITCLYHALA